MLDIQAPRMSPLLVGKSLAPALYANLDIWKKMLYSRLVSAEDATLKKEVETLWPWFKKTCYL